MAGFGYIFNRAGNTLMNWEWTKKDKNQGCVFVWMVMPSTEMRKN